MLIEVPCRAILHESSSKNISTDLMKFCPLLSFNILQAFSYVYSCMCILGSHTKYDCCILCECNWCYFTIVLSKLHPISWQMFKGTISCFQDRCWGIEGSDSFRSLCDWANFSHLLQILSDPKAMWIAVENDTSPLQWFTCLGGGGVIPLLKQLRLSSFPNIPISSMVNSLPLEIAFQPQRYL